MRFSFTVYIYIYIDIYIRWRWLTERFLVISIDGSRTEIVGVHGTRSQELDLGTWVGYKLNARLFRMGMILECIYPFEKESE